MSDLILDTGICSIFRKVDTAAPGYMPVPGYTLIAQGWYGDLAFETSSARPSDGRKELKTDARIRILQHREIRQNDIVILNDVRVFDDRDLMDTVYQVTRAYHGQDDNGPALITDLSLEVIEP